MSREIEVLREVVVKVTKLLAGQSIEVTQKGAQAYAKADPKGRVVLINIPYIPDNATPGFVAAVQGFIDHEVGHVLFTDWDAPSKAGAKRRRGAIDPRLHHAWNMVEDPFVERMMSRKFPGTAFNLDNVYGYFIEHLTKPALAKAANPMQEFAVLAVPVIRALSGQKVFHDWLTREGHFEHPLVKALLDEIDPKIIERMPALKSSFECFTVAEEIFYITHPDERPAPPAPKEKAPKKEKPKKDEPAPEPEDEPAPAPAGEPEAEAEPEPTSGEEPDEKPVSEAPSEPDDEAEPEPTPEDEDEDEPEAPAPDEIPEDETEAEGEDDTPAPPADEDEEGEGASGEEGDESEPEGEDGDGAGSGDEDEGEGDSSDGEAGSVGAESADDEAGEEEGPGDEPGEGAAEEETAGGKGSSPFASESPELTEDFSKELSKALTKESTKGAKADKYVVFDKGSDSVEPFEVRHGYDDAWLAKLDEEVVKMIAPMSKDIERMMASQSRVQNIPGFRSGRLHAGNLYRLKTGDDRVFRRREVARAKETVVSLLIDNSGSMHGGGKMIVAMKAAYALSLTLERVNVKHEVVGFTTKTAFGASAEATREAERIGRSFSRFEPLYMPIYKGFGERLSPSVKKRFADAIERPTFLRNNVDGECIEIAGRRLLEQKAERRVLIVLSDGEPAAYTDSPHTLKRHCAEAVRRVTAAGIDTVGIGIMDDAVEAYYPKHVVLHDVASLPKLVMGHLRAVLAA